MNVATRWLALACCVFSVGLMTPEIDEETKKEYARFEGTWSFDFVEVEGKKQPDLPFETNKTIICKGGRYVVVQGSKITRGIFKADLTKTPKQYDFTITDGPAKGKTGTCIYELDGDTFKFCSSFRTTERPIAFVTKPGSGTVFEILKRQKQSFAEALINLERSEMIGTWQPVSSAVDEHDTMEDDLKKSVLSIDAEGKATFTRDGKTFLAATKIDPSENPSWIDFTYVEGTDKGQASLGIYRIESSLLTICYAQNGNPRPTDFASGAASGGTLASYTRQKTGPDKR